MSTPLGEKIWKLRGSRTQVEIEGLAKATGHSLPKATQSGIENGNIKRPQPRTIEALAAVYEIDVAEIRRLIEMPPADEWLADKKPIRTRDCSNGLRYTVHKMRRNPNHSQGHSSGLQQIARGKCYDTSRLQDVSHQRLNAIIDRHKDVAYHLQSCVNIAPPPIAIVENTREEKTWVVDQWLNGRYLDEILKEDNISGKEDLCISISIGIANGLCYLHDKDIILRDLSTETIIVEQDGLSKILDFECAKLPRSSTTVRPDEGWRKSPYIAPEVYSMARNWDNRVDSFSWAKISAELFGIDPKSDLNRIRQSIKKNSIPDDIQKPILKCLSPNPNDRLYMHEVIYQERRDHVA